MSASAPVASQRPILFSAPMVRAILAGTKTQTRRAIKPQPLWVAVPHVPFRTHDANPDGIIRCPYGKPGDRLWVRETWRPDIYDGSTHYAASHPSPGGVKWKPSIHMPRIRSRITLEVTDVRVERLKGISQADAMAEGIEPFIGGWICSEETDERPIQAGDTPQEAYRHLWESINGAGSWDENPWVWVISFKRETP